jgi:NAD(P)-dependent dehydrogenase (short-subunit alcohol dehydrogenase family)
MKIKDSVAFVTGANRGLGLEFVKLLLAQGARKVYAGSRNKAEIDIAGVVSVRLDVTDPASIAAAAEQCGDTTLLINNAGIARVLQTTLDESMIDQAREIFETNFYGLIRVTQRFAPILRANGGGAVINVLSDTTWMGRPLLAAYSATKSAAWSYTNSTRVELRAQDTQVLALHMGFMDTDMTKGFDMSKVRPGEVALRTLVALEAGREEVMGDATTERLKRSLSSDSAEYLAPPAIV